MKKSKKTNIFINEKTFLNAGNYKKGKRIKKEQKRKSKLFYKYFLYIIAFLIIFFALTFLIYLLLPKNSKSINNIKEQNIKAQKDFNNIIEPYIKAQKDFCENNKKYINEIYENEIFLSNVKINELN